MYPRRGCGHWFPQAYGPNRNFQRGGWDMPQNNCFPDMPGPGWGQFDPRKQRAYDDNLDNYRGSYQGRGRSRPQGYFRETHHCRGRLYRGSKSSFSKGSYHHASRSLCLITPNKKENDSEKMEAHSATSKETEQGKVDSASSVKKTDSTKVSQTSTEAVLSPAGFSFRLTESSTYPQNKEKVPPEIKEESKLAQLENSETAEVSPSQTSPVVSAKTPTEEQTSSIITKSPHSMEKEPTVLPETKQDVILSMTGVSSAVEPLAPLKCKEAICSLGNAKTEMMKDKSNELVEDSVNQTHPVPSPGAPVEKQTTSETAEDTHPTAKENDPLLEVRQSTDHFEHASAHLDVKIPFLCETTNDHPSEEKTSSTSSHEDVSHEQKDAAITADVCSPPHTLSDIHYVPVLVRQTKTKLPSPWEIDSLLDEPLRGWAPEDCQEPPWSVNEVDKSEKASECGRGSVPSQSLPQAHVSCDQKCHIERLQYCHSCSTKSHHSSASNNSSQNCAQRELFIQRLRSPHSQERKSRSPHSREQKSRSPHSKKKRSGSSQQQEEELRSPHRQEESSSSLHRQEQSLRSPHRKKQRLKSSHRQEQSSRLYHKRKWPLLGRERSSGSPQRRRVDFGRHYYPYCNCKHSCSLPQDNFWEEDLSLHYLPGKIKRSCSPKESGKTCKVLQPCSPANNSMRTKEKKVKKVMQPEETAKKRTSSEEGKKPVKCQRRNNAGSSSQQMAPIFMTTEPSPMRMAAKSEETDFPRLPNIEEKTTSSATSWTLKDRSAAVLARTEEIEKAYLRVLLNFAGVAIMLVEKEPSMEAAIDSALRANLRRIGDYYEHMLKNYIDSLAEAS